MLTFTHSRRTLLHRFCAGMISSLIWPSLSEAYPTAQDEAIYVPKNSGDKWPIGGNDMTLKLSKIQTNGCLSFFENTLAPGFLGAPPHFHKTFDEICFVLEGTIHMLVGEEVVQLNRGDLHLRPRGRVHTFWNSGKLPARCVELSVPGGHEDYLKSISLLLSSGVSPKPSDFADFEKKYDIVYQMDKLPGIMQKYHVHL